MIVKIDTTLLVSVLDNYLSELTSSAKSRLTHDEIKDSLLATLALYIGDDEVKKRIKEIIVSFATEKGYTPKFSKDGRDLERGDAK